ncbi:helix-turn-helix domain-containing protein [Metabacillus sp. GX 13764]|uniref:helix-turn-helix domain-containing protein n=1 Tax=Metabacillus kandeliae TaxID=2900151 RepID=UPI001E4C1972|nr:helix-turn-helix domain-containing protein [Metabacillus kandeliae]MCD7033331.1 helix-turn-helix domain-containing protein [Metabacillus kandeliae]
MSYLDVLVLYSMKQFQGERSAAAVYHLLKGKRSSQTIQDLQLFKIGALFGLFPNIKKDQIEASKERLSAQGFLTANLHVSDAGLSFLEKEWQEHPLPSQLNGWKYSAHSRQYWMKLSLLVQTISNLIGGSTRFLPLLYNDEELLWVKKFLLKQGSSRQEMAHALYHELSGLLTGQAPLAAAVFTYRLTSKDRIGLTFQQLADHYKQDEWYIRVLFLNVLHAIMERSLGELPFLALLHERKPAAKTLTASTERSFRMMAEGKTIAEIAAARRLKESTIEDHMVEIALNDPDFNFSRFLHREEMDEINAVISQLDTKQLKKVKEKLEHAYSYFQIRLAFAEMRWRKGDDS